MSPCELTEFEQFFKAQSEKWQCPGVLRLYKPIRTDLQLHLK